jgi:hypothetical protein
MSRKNEATLSEIRCHAVELDLHLFEENVRDTPPIKM